MSDLQSIETLRARFENLRDKKLKAEALLSNADQELKRLKQEAEERYGTSDLETLKSKLKQIEEENKRKTHDYQKQLDQIESKIKQVETEFRS